MGTWIGRGKWAFSWEEKKAYAEKKRNEYLARLNRQKEETRNNYFTLTQLKSFLSNKDIENCFSEPDYEIKIKFGVMKLFKIKRVIATIRKNKMKIFIKKSFENIENEDAKQRILVLQKEVEYLELSQQLPLKASETKRKNKI